MKRSDPRILELFRLVREAVDVLERLAIDMHDAWPSKKTSTFGSEMPTPDLVSKKYDDHKTAYTIKEACQKVCISRSSLYQVINNKQLRAVKRGRRTLILSKDLQTWIDSWPARDRE